MAAPVRSLDVGASIAIHRVPILRWGSARRHALRVHHIVRKVVRLEVRLRMRLRCIVGQRMVVLAGGPVLTPSVPQEVYTVGLAGALWEELHDLLQVANGAAPVNGIELLAPQPLPSRHVHQDRTRGASPRRENVRGMVKFARLPEFAGSVLEIVLARGLVRADGKDGLVGVERLLSAPAALDPRRVVVLAGIPVLAPARSKIVPAVRLPGPLGEDGGGGTAANWKT